MKRLLLVEDKESLALMLKEAVEGDGLEPDVAANGTTAIDWLAGGRRYFAVVTDLRLPGADGIAVLKQVRENDPDCPVIVLGSGVTVAHAAGGYPDRHVRFIVPYPPGGITDVLARTIAQRCGVPFARLPSSSSASSAAT